MFNTNIQIGQPKKIKIKFCQEPLQTTASTLGTKMNVHVHCVSHLLPSVCEPDLGHVSTSWVIHFLASTSQIPLLCVDTNITQNRDRKSSWLDHPLSPPGPRHLVSHCFSLSSDTTHYLTFTLSVSKRMDGGIFLNDTLQHNLELRVYKETSRQPLLIQPNLTHIKQSSEWYKMKILHRVNGMESLLYFPCNA